MIATALDAAGSAALVFAFYALGGLAAATGVTLLAFAGWGADEHFDRGGL